MGYAVDRFGRKVLLIIFGGIMALSMWIIGALVKTSSGGVAAPLTFIYIYAAAFCFSFAGIPYIINVRYFAFLQLRYKLLMISPIPFRRRFGHSEFARMESVTVSWFIGYST